MDVRITIETTFDNGEKRTHQLDGISRPYRVTCPDGIGLRLEDGKRILEQIQRVILYDQVDEIIRESRVCPDCASVRAIHDYRTRDLDTLFGRVRVKAARMRRFALWSILGFGVLVLGYMTWRLFQQLNAPEKPNT